MTLEKGVSEAYEREDVWSTDFKILSACLLGNSTVQTSIVSLLKRHSSFVLRCTIDRSRFDLLGITSVSTTSEAMESCGEVAMAVVVVAGDPMCCWYRERKKRKRWRLET